MWEVPGHVDVGAPFSDGSFVNESVHRAGSPRRAGSLPREPLEGRLRAV